MKSELTIYKKWKMNIYAFIILLFVEILPFVLMNIFMESFDATYAVRIVMIIVVLAVCVSADIYFLYNRIFLLRRLLDKTPVKCTLEDIFLIRYKKDNKVRFNPYPVVRSATDGKLYLAYDKYSLSNYTYQFNYQSPKKVSCALYKADGNPVKFGDYVDMYVLQILDIPVSINESQNTVKLNGRKLYFYHVNSKIDIDIFNDITYFKGAIDLDAGVM